MEEDPVKRVSLRRADEVIGSGVDCLATACPYCLTMFVDALKTREKDESIKALDLSEIVAGALEKTS
jgi:Fe-S oxidoreductase